MFNFIKERLEYLVNLILGNNTVHYETPKQLTFICKDCIANITEFLNFENKITMTHVNKYFRAAATQNYLWKDDLEILKQCVEGSNLDEHAPLLSNNQSNFDQFMKISKDIRTNEKIKILGIKGCERLEDLLEYKNREKQIKKTMGGKLNKLENARSILLQITASIACVNCIPPTCIVSLAAGGGLYYYLFYDHLRKSLSHPDFFDVLVMTIAAMPSSMVAFITAIPSSLCFGFIHLCIAGSICNIADKLFFERRKNNLKRKTKLSILNMKFLLFRPHFKSKLPGFECNKINKPKKKSQRHDTETIETIEIIEIEANFAH